MDETFRVLVHGENFVLHYGESDQENLSYDEVYSVDNVPHESAGLSHVGVVGFYTTVTLTVADPGQLRDAVLTKLVDWLRNSSVSPIRYTDACSYFCVNRYERLTDLEETVSEKGGFTFYPMSVWKQLRSIVGYHWGCLLCKIGLRNPVLRPGIIRTLHMSYSADGSQALGKFGDRISGEST